MKKAILSIIVGLGILTQLNAQENLPCFESRYVPGEPLNPCCVIAGYPYPATISLCNMWDVYVTGEWIYWRPGKSSQIIAGISQTIAGTPTNVEALFGTPHFNSGFRVGAGVDLGPLLLDAKYTRIQVNSHDTFTAGPNQFLRSNVAAIGTVNLLSQDLRSTQKLDMLDVAVKKPIYGGTKVVLDLRYGLLTMWLTKTRNNAYVQQTGSLPGTVTSNDKTWTIGPNLGILSKAFLSRGLYAMGNFSGSMQYGKYTTAEGTISFPNIASAAVNTTISAETMHLLVPQVFAQIGLGWESYFFNDQLHLGFTVAYDSLFMSSGPNNAPNIGIAPYRSPVEQFHGFSIAGQFDF